jgi:hypothetical protein
MATKLKNTQENEFRNYRRVVAPPVFIIIYSSSYCVMAFKVTPVKSLLSKLYTLPSSGLCLCVCVCFVCLFVYDYINISLWAAELIKMELLLLLILITPIKLLLLSSSLYVFLCTRANFLTGFCVVKFARK